MNAAKFADFSFEVGETYENRAGRYTVLDINPMQDWMIIRYRDTGEKLETSISLQRRIWRNIRIARHAERQRRLREQRRFLRGYGSDFEGLSEDDFSTSIRGTSWRRREELPGAVARLISKGTPYLFTSWAVPYTPIAYLLHNEHYERGEKEENAKQARFFIELNEHTVRYGLYAKSNDGPMDAEWDFPRLLAALEADETVRETIEIVEEDYAGALLSIEVQDDDRRTLTEALDSPEGMLWMRDEVEDLSFNVRLGRINEASHKKVREIYVLTSIPRSDALDAGGELALNIADFFHLLMPVYDAAVGG